MYSHWFRENNSKRMTYIELFIRFIENLFGLMKLMCGF